MTEQREILLVGEEFATCPTCGVRLAVTDNPVDEDRDGPLFAGVCAKHGTWLIQDHVEEETEDDDEIVEDGKVDQ